jgi:hypothetical protein
VSAGGVPLQRDAAVPPVPNLPVGCQYARQAVGDSRSGLYRDGDYLIFLKHDGRPLQTGHHDIRRHKGALGENSVWMAKGRILKSDGGGADDPEEFHFDPDDTSVTVEGIVIAVFRPIVSDR